MSIRKTGHGRFEVRWRDGGRRFGRTFDRLADARIYDAEIRRRQQLGGVVNPDLVTFARRSSHY